MLGRRFRCVLSIHMLQTLRQSLEAGHGEAGYLTAAARKTVVLVYCSCQSHYRSFSPFPHIIAPPTSSSGLSGETGLRELGRGTQLCLPAPSSNPTSLETQWKDQMTQCEEHEREKLFLILI